MILVFGGTTEGRQAVKTLDEGVGEYYYSTYGEHQQIECGHGTHIVGAMSETDMLDFCRCNDVKLIVDAAHPFAANLHTTIDKVAENLNLPVIRYERHYPEIKSDSVIMCDDYADAICQMETDNVTKLLALTGVQTIAKLKPFWQKHEAYFRILDRTESLQKAEQVGFPASKLVYYETDNTQKLISEIKPDCIITKESGTTGGFVEKIEAAQNSGITVYVVRRPKLSKRFIVVNGRHGLRREIEHLLPEFYPLHTGFTTGSCATAAAKAALIGLLDGVKLNEVEFDIPEGETMRMQVESVELSQTYAVASVIKESGDDPDVTNHCCIKAKVSYADHQGIKFYGGEGVGTVTLPGLGLEVGEPAINVVPRQMICSELSKLYPSGLDVTVSLEDGEALAEKTFNPRVGIVGGVSIIGTSGIVRPFSHEAFIESIKREFDVAVAMHCDTVVVNSGGKSEQFMKSIFPSLPQHAFIHYGNAIGDVMAIAEEKGIEHLVIGIMLGKAVKLAEGNMDTHSHKVTINKTFLQQLAQQCGCSTNTVNAISQINFGRELPQILTEDEQDTFFGELGKLCHKHCTKIFGGKLDVVLISDDCKILNKFES
jgi:cobalt-precorrin-5B (C1)-methyltransferase